MSWRDRAEPVIAQEEKEEAATPSWRDRAEPAADWRSRAAEVEVTPEPTVSKLEADARGLAQGLTLGHADEIAGGAKTAWQDIKSLFKRNPDRKPEVTRDEHGRVIDIQDEHAPDYYANRDEYREGDALAATERPGRFKTGEVVGSLATGLIPGLNLGKGASAAKHALSGAGIGAVAGAGTAEEAEDVTGDAMAGAALGGVLGSAGKKVGDKAANFGKWLKGLSERRAVKSLSPILSQQELLQRRDMVEPLGRELLDEGVVKFGSSARDMLPRVSGLLSKKGAQIGDTRRAVDAFADAAEDPSLYRADLTRLQQRAADLGKEAELSFDKKIAKNLGREADSLAEKPLRSLDDTAELIRKMDSKIPYQKELADLSPNQMALREARGVLRRDMDDVIQRAGPEMGKPELFDQYQKLKDQFGLFKEGEKILEKSTARMARNNDLGLSDLLMGGLVGSSSDAQPISKMLLAGATKLARERGNSSLARVADILAKDPTKLGALSRPLINAIRKSPAQFAVTHQILADTNADYARLLRELDDGQDF